MKMETLQEMKDRIGSSDLVAKIDIAISAADKFKKESGYIDNQDASMLLRNLAIAILFRNKEIYTSVLEDVLVDAANMTRE